MRHNAALPMAGASILLSVGLGFAQSGRVPMRTGAPKTTGSAVGAAAASREDARLRAEEVLLPVAVRDGYGRSVAGLTRDDFVVAEDRVQQRIESFRVEGVPIDLMLLLDASPDVFRELAASESRRKVTSSVEKRDSVLCGAHKDLDTLAKLIPKGPAIRPSPTTELAGVRRAALDVVRRLGAEDRVSIFQFGDSVELIQDWTTDRDEVRHALNWRYRTGMETTLWDAVYLASAEQFAKTRGRRVAVVVTDGVDTASGVTEVAALNALDESGAIVYVVSTAGASLAQARKYLDDSGPLAMRNGEAKRAIAALERSEHMMRTLAERTGGALVPIGDGLAAALDRIVEDLGRQYVLTYVPQDASRDGRWRRIEVYLSKPGLTARTRRGYTASE